MKIMSAPKELLALISKKAPSNSSAKQLRNEPNTAKRLFIEYLKNTSPAIEGEAGDSTTYKVACNGHEYGLSQDTVYELMLNYFNPRCQPEWAPEELATKVENAFKYAQNEAGTRSPLNLFSNLGNQTESQSTSITTVNASDLINMSFPEHRWAIQGILPEGLTILAGPPKIGKSWLALGLSIAVSTGKLALGNYETAGGGVLYLALEDSLRRLQERIKRITGGDLNGVSKKLSFICSFPRYDEGGREEIENCINGIDSCRLVIVDTLGRFNPAPNGRMNAYDNDYRVLADMQSLALSKGIALVFITHLRKQTSEDPLAQVMGSMGITGAADAIWLLKRGRNEDTGSLKITGRDVEEQDLAIQFQKSTCQWKSLGDAAIHQIGQERKNIIEYLKYKNEAAGPQSVAKALGGREANIKNLMSKMEVQGQLFKESRGKYRLPTVTDYFPPKNPCISESTEGNQLDEV